jgi:hypothetical protein
VEARFQSYGFTFEDSFEQIDASQLQRIPHLIRIDETDLIKLLRMEEASEENTVSISPEFADTMIMVKKLHSEN